MRRAGGFLQRIAIVTGGSAGLGRVMTLALLDAGHHVTATGRNAATLEEMAAAARVAGTSERLLTVPADVASPQDCAAVVDRTVMHFGGVDALVNNAGINLGELRTPEGSPKFWTLRTDDWRRLVDTNINGTFFMSRAVAPHLIARGWGRIVNHLTSLRTMIRPGDTPYGPSKAALEAMTAAWAGEFDGTGVTVNAILPGGAANTRMVGTDIVPDRSRLVDPAVMGPPIRWLISNASDGVSGACITSEYWDPDASDDANLAQAASVCGWKPLLAAPRSTPRSWPP
jgi:NAD(P)-dependent dehydrogenase (short-subunit alcohol dehydrogenase family)